jgi:hypothetical protein
LRTAFPVDTLLVGGDFMWRLRRASLIAALAVAAIDASYYADIRGEATLDVPGVVLDTEEDSVPEYTQYGSRNVHTSQSIVSIPGQIFVAPLLFRWRARLCRPVRRTILRSPIHRLS